MNKNQFNLQLVNTNLGHKMQIDLLCENFGKSVLEKSKCYLKKIKQNYKIEMHEKYGFSLFPYLLN